MNHTGESTPTRFDSHSEAILARKVNAPSPQNRRHFLSVAVATLGITGVGFAMWPLLSSLRPSARAQAVGGPVSIDVSRLEPGERVTVLWRGNPVWVVRRTNEMLEKMTHEHWVNGLRDPESLVDAQQPPYAQNLTRSIRADVFVAVALCTHLGCVPLYDPEAGPRPFDDGWMGGFFCPCHGSRFDLAGRVAKSVPAPTNLVIPPHRFVTSDILEIGIDQTESTEGELNATT